MNESSVIRGDDIKAEMKTISLYLGFNMGCKLVSSNKDDCVSFFYDP